MGTGDVNARVCEHGSLRRQCDLCDLMQENAALRSRVEELEAEIAKPQRWQDITTAPKDGRQILLAIYKAGGASIRTDGWNPYGTAPNGERSGWWWGWPVGPLYHAPTHWMPLPAPPAASHSPEDNP